MLISDRWKVLIIAICWMDKALRRAEALGGQYLSEGIDR